jgi:hypothetical protein
MSKSGKRVTGLGALMSAIGRKQIPLCKEHHAQYDKGVYSALDDKILAKLYRRVHIPPMRKTPRGFRTGVSYLKPKRTKIQIRPPPETHTSNKKSNRTPNVVNRTHVGESCIRANVYVQLRGRR